MHVHHIYEKYLIFIFGFFFFHFCTRYGQIYHWICKTYTWVEAELPLLSLGGQKSPQIFKNLSFKKKKKTPKFYFFYVFDPPIFFFFFFLPLIFIFNFGLVISNPGFTLACEFHRFSVDFFFLRKKWTRDFKRMTSNTS